MSGELSEIKNSAELSPDDEKRELEKIVEEDESKDHHLNKNGSTTGTQNVPTEMTIPTGAEPRTPVLRALPIKGPETLEFTNNIRAAMESISKIQSAIVSITGNDATIIDINDSDNLNEAKSMDECCEAAANVMEKIFKFSVSDFEGMEEDEAEEEEEGGEEAGEEESPEGEDEGEEEEEDEDNYDPSLKDKKQHFGETNYFCPVTLYKRGILVPGNPELQCKYREKIYRFNSEESKQAFFDNPEIYLPNAKKKIKIPAPRIFILGPRGSGKSTQARLLANKLDVFHIKFRDYLQELIIGKTKKYIEPERDEDKDIDEEQDELDEEEKEKQYV